MCSCFRAVLGVPVFGDWMTTSILPLTSHDLSPSGLCDCVSYHLLLQTHCWFAAPQTLHVCPSLGASVLAVPSVRHALPPCSCGCLSHFLQVFIHKPPSRALLPWLTQSKFYPSVLTRHHPLPCVVFFLLGTSITNSLCILLIYLVFIVHIPHSNYKLHEEGFSLVFIYHSIPNT